VFSLIFLKLTPLRWILVHTRIVKDTRLCMNLSIVFDEPTAIFQSEMTNFRNTIQYVARNRIDGIETL